MSHDTHNGHSTENKTIISFKSSFWLIIILVGVFVAALNFIQAESGGEEGHEGHGEATHEMHHAAGHEGHEATHEGGKEDANGEAAKTEKSASPPTVADTAHKAEH